LKFWKTNPIRRLRSAARSCFESREISWPSNRHDPEVGWSRQPKRFISVVLPEPEAPIRATNSPRSIESDTPLSTGTSSWPRW
jgi:hypothetical protein